MDAAATGRRWNGAPVQSRSINSEIQSGARITAARAAHLTRNDPMAASAVQALVSGIVGPGVRPVSGHPDADTREHIHRLWRRWIEVADFDGGTGFYGLQSLAVQMMVRDGEAFGHMLMDEAAPGPIPLRIRLLPYNQVPLDFPLRLHDHRVRAGIELDDFGRVVAFHALRHRPDDVTAPLAKAWETVRLPADDVCHLFAPQEAGQLRGLSWLAPAMLPLHDLSEYKDAALMRAKVAGLLAGVIIDADGSGGGLDGTQDGDTLTAGLEPGTLISLPPGKSIEFLDPKESAHYEAFTKAHLRAVAAGLGIPFEVLTGNLESVNYSSIRAGLVEYRRKVEAWQNNILVFKFCRPVWNRFIEFAALAGELPGYDRDPAAFHDATWLAPRQPWVDPAKDVQADAAAVAAGFKSRSSVIASLGRDPEQVDRELAADQERAGRLGLAIERPAPPTPEPTEAPADA
ncbi:MAG: phage portal protein [Alphaproteobacteria bacterium]|nr:phage portal protein [Alphaproteobacteria bacterium]